MRVKLLEVDFITFFLLFFIDERVRVGLHNAKMKGIKIGRKKTRPSELIRRLRSKGLTYKEISRIAGCSQGAVSTEIKSWAKEKSENGDSEIVSTDIPAMKNEPTIEAEEELEVEPLEIIRF